MRRSKRTNYTDRFAITSLLAALLLVTPTTTAQSEPPPKPAAGKDDAKPERRRSDDDVTKVIPVQHVAAHELAPILSQTFRGAVSLAVDERTNSIIASTGKDTLARVESLLKELDVEHQDSDAARETRFYDLEKAIRADVNPNEVAQTVQRLVSRDSMTSVVGSLLAVRAAQAEHTKVKELVEQLSRGGAESGAAARGVTITCYFLQSGRGSGTTEKAAAGQDAGHAAMPDTLKPVAAALAENGFRRAELISTLTVHANLSGREFSVEGALGGATYIEASGNAKPGGTADAVELRMSAKMHNKSASAMRGGVSGPEFFIQSAVTLKLGQFIVLAAAPSRTEERDSVALVIRATEAK